MMAKWEKKDTNKGELTFEIAQEEIKKGLDRAFNRVRRNLNVPGFRKGKVTRQIFNRMYGEESLYEDTLNLLLPGAYDAAVAETKIEPVDQPEISIEKMEKNEPWEIKATVTVKPEVELGQYKNLTVPKQDRRVLVKDVNAELDKLRNEQAELVLKEDGKAKKGDTVTIDYAGSIDGKPFEGGKADNYSLELGSGSFIPGFEDQLIGHKAGDEVEVKVTFPEDYHAKDVAGKDAVFKVKIHEVREKQLPKLDDEFAKDVDEDVDTLDELKKKIKEELTKQKNEAADAAVEDAAIEEATNNATIKEIPQAMIDKEIQDEMNQYLGNIQRQGINPKLYFQITGTTEDDLRKHFAENAEQHVRTNLVLDAIVDAENIKPSQEEIDKEIKNLADEYKMKEAQVRAALSNDILSHDIAIRDAIKVITDSAKEEAKKSSKKTEDDKKDSDK
ncbi:MAG: trigger factor [Candidatus Paralactobacillus gallistercoris]|uniref:Trigger factor n=1 Tax=Candidatus Paralactobacillus gallistercoris TaxID=2838724 RepID=A0A948X0E7_9LACO|nr:trigger factor [Candidatus Paralactobacillus gallistercoris]